MSTCNSLFNSRLDDPRIVSMDIDKNCEEIAYTMNKDYEMDGRFKVNRPIC